MKSWLASFASAAAALAIAAGGATAADDGVAAAAKAAKSAPFVKSGQPCGSANDLYFCVALSPNDFGPKLISKFKVKIPRKGTALVTWNGSVYCDVTGVPDRNMTFNLVRGVTSNYVDLAITQGSGEFVYNQPGAVSVGELTESRIPREVGFNQMRKVFLAPVSLSKTFAVKSGSETYQITAAARFIEFHSPAFCNVNGGVMTVQYFPD